MDSFLRGSLVALPTPFRGGEIDLQAFGNLIRKHRRAGTQGVVVLGTTGESCTVSARERAALVRTAVEFAEGKLTVVVGVGTNDTTTSVEYTRQATDAGADALLAVTPYYNRPCERGLLLHYGKVASATTLPIVLYNVPVRTGVDLKPTWARRLGAEHENIVALKEATQSIDRAREACEESGLKVLCGEDSLIAPFARFGAVGAVNVVGNVLPGEVADWLRALGTDDQAPRAHELERIVLSMVEVLSLATNPVPVKAALALKGWCSDEVRSPLAPLTLAEREELTERYREACVPA